MVGRVVRQYLELNCCQHLTTAYVSELKQGRSVEAQNNKCKMEQYLMNYT